MGNACDSARVGDVAPGESDPQVDTRLKLWCVWIVVDENLPLIDEQSTMAIDALCGVHSPNKGLIRLDADDTYLLKKVCWNAPVRAQIERIMTPASTNAGQGCDSI